MSGAGLMDFLITIVGLFIVGALIFTAIEFISTDARFKLIAKLAVGGVLVLAFLLAVKGVLFGGGGAGLTMAGLITFAIGVIVLLVVWFIIDKAIGWMATWFPPMAPLVEIIRFVVSAIVLVVLLILAANMLFGGIATSTFQHWQHQSQIEWSAGRLAQLR